MPCIFCIAVFAALAGTVTAALVDRTQRKLEEEAEGPVRRVADTKSVAKFEATFRVGRKQAPVAITLYKEHGRARIQILTHDLDRDDVEKLQNHLADLLDLKILARSDPESEAKVHAAFHRHADEFAAGAPLERERGRERRPG